MRTRLLWSALALCVVAAFLAVWLPLYVIRPFRSQGPRELEVALWVRAWGPWIAAAAAAGAVVSMVALWRGAGWKTRAGAGLCAAVAIAFAALSYVNVFELMFHRIGAPQAIAASAAKVDADDMVLAVGIHGQNRAYPVREMAYHHIANDWVGGEPVAATY